MNATSPHPSRVLVVDNDQASRDILVRLLEVSGFDVLSADTGERGLLALRQWGRRIDWLFTAVSLPGLVDGWIVGDEYHLSHPHRRVVYACGRETDVGRETDGSVFIEKPVAPMQAVAIIKGLVEAAPVRVPPAAAPLRAAAG